MANPQEDSASQDNSEMSFDEVVSLALKSSTKDDKGKIQFPEETPEHVRVAAIAEKRRRDTVSSNTKLSQEVSKLRATNEELQSLVNGKIPLNLSEEQKEELEELKSKDEVAYVKKYSSYLNLANEEFEKRIEEKVAKQTEAEWAAEADKALIEYREKNPEFNLTASNIEYDIPKKFTDRWRSGELSHTQYFNLVNDFFGSTVGDGQEISKMTSLSEADGSSRITEGSIKEQDFSTKFAENKLTI